MIKRYGKCQVFDNPPAIYVRAEDCDALQSERDALAAEVAIAREYLDGIAAMEPKHGMNAHARISDPQDMKIGWNTRMAAKHALALMNAARTTGGEGHE